MFNSKVAKLILFVLFALPVLFTSACNGGLAEQVTLTPSEAATAAPAAATTAPSAVTTAPSATIAPVLPTAEPTAIPPSPTVEPTIPPTPTTPPATPTSAPQADKLTAWCMPAGYFPVSATTDPTIMPTNGITGSTVKGTLSFQVPFSSCTFVYTFGQPKPAGTTLQVYDLSSTPWLTVTLKASSSNPNVMYAVLTHTYITNPPLWSTTYRFVVAAPDGTKIKEDSIIFHRYTPALCWNGLLPNVNTLTCQKQQDIHPWDASYPTKYYNCTDPTCVK